MADWHLAFRNSRPVTVEACAHVLSAVVEGPATTDIGALEGNPRDFYSRSVTLRAQRPGGEVHLAMSLTLSMMTPTDPNPITTLYGVTLHAPAASFATKLATWHALRDAFASLGCADGTLTASPAPIVDDAEAAGKTATAARLRACITAALVAEAPSHRSVTLVSTRPDDIEAVLAAYLEPLHVRTVAFCDCKLSTLPAGCARFPNVETLSLVEDDLDGPTLCGVSLPKLTGLYLAGSGVRSVSREDLAGFPLLAELYLQNSPLQRLDPDIIKACTNLRRVLITNTPLGRDARQAAALRARWKGVTWQ